MIQYYFTYTTKQLDIWFARHQAPATTPPPPQPTQCTGPRLYSQAVGGSAASTHPHASGLPVKLAGSLHELVVAGDRVLAKERHVLGERDVGVVQQRSVHGDLQRQRHRRCRL